MAKTCSAPENLFPILDQPPAGTTGLARMAAEAVHTADGHQIEFRAIRTRSILNRSVSRRQLSLAWSINPYRGCEFGCKYCYARYTHEFLEPAQPSEEPTSEDAIQPWAQAFERRVYMKQNAAWLLAQELRRIDPEDEIAIGTATDPYQPIERSACITRSLLEVFAQRSGYRIGLVTKSTLIERDVDLLRDVARRNTLVLHLTITTPDAKLARILEPRAPRPDLRLQTVQRLRAAGLTAGILCSPLLPGITDTAESIDRMAKLAAKTDASFFAAEPLFLKSCSLPTFRSFLSEHFPHLAQDYERRFASDAFATPQYRNQLAILVQRACRRYHLPTRSTYAILTRTHGAKPPASAQPPLQQALFA